MAISETRHRGIDHNKAETIIIDDNCLRKKKYMVFILLIAIIAIVSCVWLLNEKTI